MAHQDIFTMQDLRRVHPPNKEVLKGIYLSFYPGAKIGVIGGYGAGKSTLLRIMAGVDKNFFGEARPADGTRIGYPDRYSAGKCVEGCVEGDRRCKELIPQSCTTAGLWPDNRSCLYRCSAGACTGECTPGNRRCRDNTVQICNSAATWGDQESCTGSTCAAGQCLAACLASGQDCTDPKNACCQGSECVNTVGSTYACRAVTCAALASDCKVNTDCCAGLDCSGGKCASRAEGCSEKPADGACSAQSPGTCCPGTVCSSAVCSLPSGTKPQDGACLRDKPTEHDPCSSARLGLSCAYSDWVKEPGIFYTCTCSYFGWSCVKGYYV